MHRLLPLLLLTTGLFISPALSGTCSAGFSYTLRETYTSDGKLHSVYDTTITNTGSCPIVSAELRIYNDAVNVEQKWNLEQASGSPILKVQHWNPLAPGQSYSGAGFISTHSSGNGDPQLRLRAPCDPSCYTPPSCAELGCECDEVCAVENGVARCNYDSSLSGCRTNAGASTSSTTTSGTTTDTSSSSLVCSSISLTHQLVSAWEGASQWTVFLTNDGPLSVEDVVISTSTPLYGLWPLKSLGNGRYSFPEWQGAIAPREMIQFSYNIAGSARAHFTVESVACPGSPPGGIIEANCGEYSVEDCPAPRCLLSRGHSYCGADQLFCMTRPQSGVCRSESNPVCARNKVNNAILEFQSDCIPDSYAAFDPTVPTCAAGTLTCAPNQVCVDGYNSHTCSGYCSPTTIGTCYNTTSA